MFPPARTGVLTYAGLTAYALAPEGGFSAGGCTTDIRLYCEEGDMSRVEQGFDLFLTVTRSHLVVMEASLMVDCRIDIGVKGQAARLAAKRLLLRPVGARDEVTVRAFLGGVRRPTCLGGLPTLFCAPGKLTGKMGEVRCVQVCVHPAGFEPHPTHVQVFISNLMIRMIGVERIHGPVDLLPDVASQALIDQRWQARDALLFQTGAQFGLPAALLAIALVSAGELPMKRAVTFAGTRGQEVRDAGIHPDHRRLISSGRGDVLVHRQ